MLEISFEDKHKLCHVYEFLYKPLVLVSSLLIGFYFNVVTFHSKYSWVIL